MTRKSASIQRSARDRSHNGRSRSEAQPIVAQRGRETQRYGSIVRMPIGLSESACKSSVDALNQVLADTMTLRDLYKKHHWQASGPAFYQLHLLFEPVRVSWYSLIP
jgi:starvation-inducible DNA-binding protein